jgi:hypothetical protein
MAKTQGTIVTEARDRLNELTPNRWEDRQLRSWINDGIRDVARRSRCHRDTATVSATSGTQEYTAPATAFMIHGVRYNPDSNDQEYDLISYRYKDVLAVSQTQLTISENTPRIYWQWGTSGSMTFGVYPTPSEDGDFTVHYYAIPADLDTEASDITTNVDVPMGWEDCLVDYCIFTAFKSSRDPRWESYKTDYIDNLTLLIDITQGEGYNDQVGRVVAGTPSSPFGYATAGWDDGWGGW